MTPPTLHGAHPPGIAGAAPRPRRQIGAFDAPAPDWPDLAEELMRPRRDTVTIGFGAEHFTGDAPVGLRPLPPFPGDDLEPHRCDGAICVLIASDEPTDALTASARPAGPARRTNPDRRPRLPRRHDEPAPPTRPRPPRLGHHPRPPGDDRRDLPRRPGHPRRPGVARPDPSRAGAHHRPRQAHRRAARRQPPVREAGPGAPGPERSHPPGVTAHQRRDHPPARLRHAARPSVPRLHERSAPPVRCAPAPPGRQRRPPRVHEGDGSAVFAVPPDPLLYAQ